MTRKQHLFFWPFVFVVSIATIVGVQSAFGATDFGNGVVGFGYDIIQDYDNIFKPYRFTETNDIIQVETKDVSYVFDKSGCSISIFDGGLLTPESTPKISSDSFTFLGAVNGTDNFVQIPAINNAFCNAEVILSSKIITVQGTKHADGKGTAVIKFIKPQGKDLKTEIDVTNLNPAWNNHNLGIIETIHVPQFIEFGGQVRDLSNYNGQFFDRDWFKNNKAEVVKLFEDLNYDIGFGFKDFYGATIVYENGQAKIAFEYTYNDQIILPNQTFTLDPVWVAGIDTIRNVETALQTGASCGSPNSIAGTQGHIRLPDANNNESCFRMGIDIDISKTPIPDDADIITLEAFINSDGDESANMSNCDIYHMNATVQSYDDANDNQGMWDDIRNGTVYLDNNNWCNTSGNDILINFTDTQFMTDFETAIDNENDTISLGFSNQQTSRSAGTTRVERDYDNFRFNATWAYLPDKVSENIARFNTPHPYDVTLTWNTPDANNGGSLWYQVQRDVGSGWTTLASNQSATSYIDLSPPQISNPKYRIISGNSYGWNTAYSPSLQGQELKSADYYWDFDWNQNATSGNLDFTTESVTPDFMTGVVGNARNQTGDVRFGDVADFEIETDTPFTMMFWHYPTRDLTGEALFAKRDGTWTGQGWDFRKPAWDNIINFCLEDDLANADCWNSASVPLNEWTHIAVSYDGNNNLATYHNGQFEETVSFSALTGDLSPTSNDFVIGARGDYTADFAGGIDQFLYWKDTALTATQIQKMYELTDPINPTPLTHIPFDYDFKDIGILKNNGTINAGQQWDFVAGQNGNAFNFTNSEWIIIPTESDYDKEVDEGFSFFAWIKPTDTATTRTIASKLQSFGAGLDGWDFIITTTDVLRLEVKTNGGTFNQIQTTGFDPDNGNWHWVGFTYNGTSNRDGVRIFVNGSENVVGTTNTLVTSLENNENLVIGCTNICGSGKYDGLMDEVMYFPRWLTPDEVSDIWNEQIDTIDSTTLLATVTPNTKVVGDALRVGVNVTNLGGFPSTQNVTNIEIWNGTSLLSNVTGLNEPIGVNQVYPYQWYWDNINNTSVISANTTMNNGVTTQEFQATSTSTANQEYYPTLFDAVSDNVTPSTVNYTWNDSDIENRILKVNRPLTSGVWNISCYKVTGLNDADAEWQNNTNVGFHDPTWSTQIGDTLYVTCYNPDEVLFTTISYGNLTGILVGLAGAEDALGTLFGLPLIFMFVLMVASLDKGSDRSMGLLITMIVVGILSAIGAFAFGENVWGIILVISAFGLFAIRQYL